MAYRELGMVQVREVLRRWLAGEGVRAIARAAGVDRKTIAAYVRSAVVMGIQRGGAPPTDEQLTALATTRRPGRPTNKMAPSPELERLRPQAADPAVAGRGTAPDEDLSAPPQRGCRGLV